METNVRRIQVEIWLRPHEDAVLTRYAAEMNALIERDKALLVELGHEPKLDPWTEELCIALLKSSVMLRTALRSPLAIRCSTLASTGNELLIAVSKFLMSLSSASRKTSARRSPASPWKVRTNKAALMRRILAWAKVPSFRCSRADSFSLSVPIKPRTNSAFALVRSA